jgi:effector-binding domain-containing protein
MKDKIEAVKAFHTAFKIGHKETPKADLGIQKNLLRYELMREENEEYLEAANNDDLVEVADALGDLLYILCGTIIEHGLQYKIDGITEYGGGFYLYKTTSASASNISNMMARQYTEIMNFMQDHNVTMAGMPFTIYNEMNDNGNVIMSNAIPVRDKVIVADDSNVLCGYIEKTRAVKATLKGNYTNLGEAWKAAMKYVIDNKLEQSEQHPFEIYLNDPGDNPNPANYLTEIYIPIKESVVSETE